MCGSNPQPPLDELAGDYELLRVSVPDTMSGRLALASALGLLITEMRERLNVNSDEAASRLVHDAEERQKSLVGNN